MAIDFKLKKCGENEIDNILKIQEEAFEAIESPELLRRNTPEMLRACLCEPHYTIGAYCNNVLVGFAVLYDGGNDDENLGKDMGYSKDELNDVINLKLVIVSPKYRGNGLQCRMTKELEKVAAQKKKSCICVTVSPDNKVSRKNIENMGYKFHSQKTKYDGLVRNLYYKVI